MKDLLAGDMTRLNTAVNNAIRKIFGFSHWQRLRDIRSMFGYKSVTEIFAKRRSDFLKSLPTVPNSLILELLKYVPIL